ncbi:hypothetical protein H0H87_007700, partial [Tephrocybe sp. NHM501043]
PSQPSMATLSLSLMPDEPFDAPAILADLNDDFHRRRFDSFFAARPSEPPRNSNESRSNPWTPPTRPPSRTTLQTTSTIVVDVVSRRSRPCGPSRNPG